MSTNTGILSFALHCLISPYDGVIPPCSRFWQSSILSAPPCCAFKADWIELAQISSSHTDMMMVKELNPGTVSNRFWTTFDFGAAYSCASAGTFDPSRIEWIWLGIQHLTNPEEAQSEHSLNVATIFRPVTEDRSRWGSRTACVVFGLSGEMSYKYNALQPALSAESLHQTQQSLRRVSSREISLFI